MNKNPINAALMAALGAILVDAGCELPFAALAPLNHWMIDHPETGAILVFFMLLGVGLFLCVGLFVLVRRGMPAWARKICLTYPFFILACYALGAHSLEAGELRRWTAEGLLCPLLFLLMAWRLKPEAPSALPAARAKGARKGQPAASALERVLANEAKADETVSQHEKQHWLMAAVILLFLALPELAIHLLKDPLWLGRGLAALACNLGLVALALWWFFNPLDLIVDRGKDAQIDRLEKTYRLSYRALARNARLLAAAAVALFLWFSFPVSRDLAGLALKRESVETQKAAVSSSHGGAATGMILWTVLLQGNTSDSYTIYYPSGVPREGETYQFSILPHSKVIVAFEPLSGP
jgi:hypothetical protein